MNLLDLTDRQAVLLDIVAWVVLGYLGHRIPPHRLDQDRGPLRLRPFETGGAWYAQRLRIKRWKDRLPEAGAAFGGGLSKRRLPGHRPTDLADFARETRRAELVHGTLVAASVAFVLWNPWWLAGVMVLYALVANGPCLLVQRYNRARVDALLTRLP